MPEDSCAEYSQENNERLQKRCVKDIKTCPTKKRKQIDNMVANEIKIYLKMKKKGWLSTEKNTIKLGKTLHNN